MRCRCWVSACVILLCSLNTEAMMNHCTVCKKKLCDSSWNACPPNKVWPMPCPKCPLSSMFPAGNWCKEPSQRQCLRLILMCEECMNMPMCPPLDETQVSLMSVCTNESTALENVCQGAHYITDEIEEDCFFMCNETMEDSESKKKKPQNTNMNLLSYSECFDVDRKYCRRPGRALKCVDRCVQRRHCPRLVKKILGENVTRDDVDATANIIQELAVGMGMRLGDTIMAVQGFNQQSRKKKDVAIEYFNNTKYQRDFTGVYERLLDDDVQIYWKDLAIDQGFGPALLESIESSAELFSEATDVYDMPFHFSGRNIEMNVEHITQRKYRRTFYHNVSGELLSTTVELPMQSNTGSSSIVISTAVMQNLIEYVNQNSSKFHGSTPAIGQPILSVQLSGENITSDNPAKLFFSRFQNENVSTLNDYTYTCVSWDFGESDWSEVDTDWNDTHFICSTPHLTSFAVLVTVSNITIEAQALTIISYIGCGVSIVCLIATILTLVLLRKKHDKGMLLYIHLNLSIALLIGLIIFVAGIETATSINWLCKLIAALLHYFFLAVFCWMLAEGIMLYLLLVRVFGNAASKWYWLMPLGWGLPVPVVAVSVGIRYKNYGTSGFCWMSLEEGTIWGFIGPMIAIIIVNAIILVVTVVSIVKVKGKVATEEDRKLIKIVKIALKSAFILLPLLGVTWVFGLLAVNESTTVFAWLFTIFNSLQGCFIFFLHVLRNDQVLAAFRKVTCRVLQKKEKDSVVTTETTAESSPSRKLASSSTGIIKDSETCTSSNSPNHFEKSCL